MNFPGRTFEFHSSSIIVEWRNHILLISPSLIDGQPSTAFSSCSLSQSTPDEKDRKIRYHMGRMRRMISDEIQVDK